MIENYSTFYGLLNRLPTSDRDSLKESIVLQFTGNRTSSLKEMTVTEYNEACAAMKKMVPPTYKEQVIKIMKEKRSAALHQMQLYGINTADWTAVDNFCLDKRIAGKKFRDLDGQELDELQVKIRGIRRKKENE